MAVDGGPTVIWSQLVSLTPGFDYLGTPMKELLFLKNRLQARHNAIDSRGFADSVGPKERNEQSLGRGQGYRASSKVDVEELRDAGG